MSHKDTTASQLDTDAFEWQPDRMFIFWDSAIQEISNWIQVAGTFRSTAVLDKVHMAFFNSDDFIDMTTRPNEILLATFMLA